MDQSKLNQQEIIFTSPVNSNGVNTHTPQSNHSQSKIYAREQKGKWQQTRRYLNVVLMALFICLPWIEYQGQQAIYFDVATQQFNFFSLVLFPSDLFIFCLVFMLAAFGLFYITKFYGWVWCGFACPQTIWTLMFNWVERRVEGSHNKSKQLDQQPLNINKVSKKLIKHSVWMAISIFTALVFMSYFVPAKSLYLNFIQFELSSTLQAWVWFFVFCTYINAGWMKEKMCQHVCPYSRFQSAMFDTKTWLIDYDSQRGENRGRRKIGQQKKTEQGDCVDCDLCVQVCPVGIDIRNGIQYECISCGLCIDACDQTMSKFKYAKNLIGFRQEQRSEKSWSRHLAYGLVISLTIITMLWWAQHRVDFDLTVSRDRQALYRVNDNDEIENSYIVKVRNKSRDIKQYTVELANPATYTINGQTQFTVLPGELYIATVVAARPDNTTEQRGAITLVVRSISQGTSVEQNTSFYGPKS